MNVSVNMNVTNVTRFAAAVLATAPLSLFSPPAISATATTVDLRPYQPRLHDTHSLQRGAQLFVNYCLSCHSAQFMRFSRMAEDLEIPPEIMKRNMMFTTGKIGDTMQAVMTAEDGEAWFGIAPPDLSLSARLRGGRWLYNYFLGFYLDETAPSGWNNTVFPNVAMPHALHALQGLQRAVDDNGTLRLQKVSEGSMNDEEYMNAVADLTNFLVYIGEPSRPARLRYGIWVMFFLLGFTFLAYLLKKEYWRDVEQSRP